MFSASERYGLTASLNAKGAVMRRERHKEMHREQSGISGLEALKQRLIRFLNGNSP